VTASAALEEGKIAVDTPITCHGVLEVAGYPFYCWNRGGHGTITVVDGLAQSCDVFFYTCANLLGDITLARYARVFGVGEVTGVELDGEALGVAPDRNWKTAYFKANSLGDEPWYIGDTLHAGIGQGYVLVTPLQMARLTCAVANGGRLYNPTLIRSAAPAGSAANSGAPRLERGLGIDPAHLEVVRQGMRQSVLTGTSYMLRGKPYEPAGKTGTAEYGLPDAHDVLPSHAWFTSFAPTSAPEVVVTVFIEGGGEGSTFAQPVAVKALDYYFANRDALRER
jgi:penicillin-binding protein 2